MVLTAPISFLIVLSFLQPKKKVSVIGYEESKHTHIVMCIMKTRKNESLQWLFDVAVTIKLLACTLQKQVGCFNHRVVTMVAEEPVVMRGLL